ncbi:hypothetical protein FGO68_gene6622 [Halteria grandinella]|uniref:Uncharacterized protein n=1 Tax=Halteria grandinella TaxID=5974 RepID=A0A8J8NCA2_HALGN|nr:hypothetical protein FGO68_gene6622 [Halteria grandinella]
MGIGGNELPGIFNHKPKLDPRMMVTPSRANNVAYPRVQDIEGAQELMDKFNDESNQHIEDGFDPITSMNVAQPRKMATRQQDPIKSIIGESIRDTNMGLMPQPVNVSQPLVEAVVEDIGNEQDDLLTQKATSSKRSSKKVKKKVKVKKKKYKGGGVLVEEEVEV